jgi:hypothetical protein
VDKMEKTIHACIILVRKRVGKGLPGRVERKQQNNFKTYYSEVFHADRKGT